MKQRLDAGQRHLLRLVAKGKGSDGWSKVSSAVWPLVKELPDDLVDKVDSVEGGEVRLTPIGEAVLTYIV